MINIKNAILLSFILLSINHALLTCDSDLEAQLKAPHLSQQMTRDSDPAALHDAHENRYTCLAFTALFLGGVSAQAQEWTSTEDEQEKCPVICMAGTALGAAVICYKTAQQKMLLKLFHQKHE